MAAKYLFLANEVVRNYCKRSTQWAVLPRNRITELMQQ